MAKLHEKVEINTFSYGTFTFSCLLLEKYVIFEKYARIKIEDHKILVLMSVRSPKLDEINQFWLKYTH